MKFVAKEQHIDYDFNGLEDDDGDDIDDNDDGEDTDEFESQDESELSFDYGQNPQGQDHSASRTEMEVSI